MRLVWNSLYSSLSSSHPVAPGSIHSLYVPIGIRCVFLASGVLGPLPSFNGSPISFQPLETRNRLNEAIWRNEELQASLPVDTAVSGQTGVNLVNSSHHHPNLPLCPPSIISKSLMRSYCSLDASGGRERLWTIMQKNSIKWISGSILVWQT